VAASRTHLVVKRGSLSTSIVSVGLTAPGVQLGSESRKPFLMPVVQLCLGGRVTVRKGVGARPSKSSRSQVAGLNISGALGGCEFAVLGNRLDGAPSILARADDVIE
jgi:hypothetical protein